MRVCDGPAFRRACPLVLASCRQRSQDSAPIGLCPKGRSSGCEPAELNEGLTAGSEEDPDAVKEQVAILERLAVRARLQAAQLQSASLRVWWLSPRRASDPFAVKPLSAALRKTSRLVLPCAACRVVEGRWVVWSLVRETSTGRSCGPAAPSTSTFVALSTVGRALAGAWAYPALCTDRSSEALEAVEVKLGAAGRKSWRRLLPWVV